jgi:tetratricopeptide (TPR) repeat protein
LVVSACAARNARSPANRGQMAADEQQWVDALAAYDQAVAAEPQRLEWRRQRVRAARLSGQLSALRLRLESSEQSSDPVGLYEIALVHAVGGQPRSDVRALRLLEQVAEQLPQEPDVFYRMGLLRMEQENFALAIEPLEQALALAPNAAAYRVALASVRASQGQAQRAREALQPLPELEPDGADLQRAQAIMAAINDPSQRVPWGLRDTYREAVAALVEEETNPGEAVQLIEEALTAAPDCQPFLVLDGLAAARLGQQARARVALERATALYASDPSAWLELAFLEVAMDRLAEAEGHLQRGLRADPISAEIWAELGRVRYERRRFAEAAEAFRRLLVVDGGRTMTYLWLGRALRRGGEDQQAEQVYQQLLRKHPGNYEACLQLGHIYRRRRLRVSDHDEAEELLRQARRYYRQALEVRPEDPMVQRLLQLLEGGA